MERKAIVIGATGLVGQLLVDQLSEVYDSLIIIARQQPKHISANMQFYQLKDFNNLDEVMTSLRLESTCDAFTCLGTTKRSAGSEAAFRKIDYDYNLTFATLCKNAGIAHFYLLSASGANNESRIFYNRVKGEVEVAIKQLHFEELVIFRPSLLLGKHKGRPLETGTQLAYRLISPLVPKSLAVRPIAAIRVAAAMTLTAQQFYERARFNSENSTYTVSKPKTSNVTIVSNQQMLEMTKRKT